MDTVTLKTKRGVGTFEFRRQTTVYHPVTGKPYNVPVTYGFNFENNFRTAVPKQVWEEIKGARVDKNTLYSDILYPL
jgi:hypothetical protein